MHETPSESTDKMSRYRERLREQGLRPIQLWVPDTGNPDFILALKKELASLSFSSEKEALTFIEGASDFEQWQ